MINKKCALVTDLIRINPLYDFKTLSIETKLFPMIETLQCDSLYLSNENLLSLTIKSIHLIDTKKEQINNTCKIPINYLSIIHSYTTITTSLSLLYQLKNITYLKLICVHSRVKGNQIFNALKRISTLKNVIINCCNVKTRHIILPLLRFNTKNIHFLIICNELCYEVKKDNVKIACSFGNELNSSLIGNSYTIVPTHIINDCKDEYWNKRYVNNLFNFSCYKYNLFTISNSVQFHSLLINSLPKSICFDITKHISNFNPPFKLDLSLFNDLYTLEQLWLIGTTKRLNPITVILPSSVKMLGINIQSYSIVNGSNIIDFAYTTTHDKLVDFTVFQNIKNLCISDQFTTTTLNLSPLQQLGTCDISCISKTIIFPKHLLKTALLDCKNTKIFQDLSANELILRIGNVFKSFIPYDPNDFLSIQMLSSNNSISNFKLDLSIFSKLHSIQFEKELVVSSFPQSLTSLDISNCPSSNLNHLQNLLSPQCKLQSLKLPYELIQSITTVTSLTALTVTTVLNLNDDTNYLKCSSLQQLTNLEILDIRYFPIPLLLPTSLTYLRIKNINCYNNPYIQLDYLIMLQYLYIMIKNVSVHFPTQLTYLVLETNDMSTFQLKNISLKHLELGLQTNTKDLVTIELPTTLEIANILIEGKGIYVPDLSNNFKLREFRYRWFGNSFQGVDLGKFYLPSSLELFTLKIGNEVRVKFDNIENTKLSDNWKKYYCNL